MAVQNGNVHARRPFVNRTAAAYNRPMRVIGLTGGICAGKSAVAAMFADLGIPVVDADRVSREVTARGRPAHAEIVRVFGEEVLAPDGEIDRRRLGEIVFADPVKRAALQDLTHPAIVEEIGAALSRLAAQGHRVVLVEAALILETGRRGLCDAVIVVHCGRDRQIERLMARDGIGREQALRRLEAQMDPDRKARAADYVIDNSGSLEQTRDQVRALAARLLAET